MKESIFVESRVVTKNNLGLEICYVVLEKYIGGWIFNINHCENFCKLVWWCNWNCACIIKLLVWFWMILLFFHGTFRHMIHLINMSTISWNFHFLKIRKFVFIIPKKSNWFILSFFNSIRRVLYFFLQDNMCE